MCSRTDEDAGTCKLRLLLAIIQHYEILEMVRSEAEFSNINDAGLEQLGQEASPLLRWFLLWYTRHRICRGEHCLSRKFYWYIDNTILWRLVHGRDVWYGVLLHRADVHRRRRTRH